MRDAEGWKIALQKDNQDHGKGDQSPVDPRIGAMHGPSKFPMVRFLEVLTKKETLTTKMKAHSCVFQSLGLGPIFIARPRSCS